MVTYEMVSPALPCCSSSGRTTVGRCLHSSLACKQSVRLSDGRARGFAKRTSEPEPIYFLHFTALLLWFLVVASLHSSLLSPYNHLPRRNFECFSRIRIGRPRSAAGQSAAVDTRWGDRQTAPQGSGWAATPGARRTEQTTRRLQAP